MTITDTATPAPGASAYQDKLLLGMHVTDLLRSTGTGQVRRGDDGGNAMAIDSELSTSIDTFRRRLMKVDWSSQSPSRRQILEVFLVLALERGINSVSMRMIAQEIGIKAPSIYSHFPNGRNEILAEASRWHFYKFGTALLTALATCKDANQCWTAMVTVHTTRQLTLPESNLWDLLMATDKMVHTLPSEVREEADEMVVLYENLYRAAAREMGVSEPDGVVDIVMTLLEGATRWCDADFSKDVPPELIARVDRMTRVILETARVSTPRKHAPKRTRRAPTIPSN
ncbi:TetR/AcrR family transcriptional regulator [Rhodococcoides fascians]|uniref:TetR/AcrR family transcriptional regulator n=1 Tax=Rhodococcoides fascians TaxID=1828 RepID=UPI001C907AC6|nr:TetR/AcrR family transcriptional regulator [Rhodococcus fascians]MBY4012751.1 TetR/AcrR family transcriptional regulator [Rhodococcus fascians]MBY4022443.1 TetR/AcrR family transcriptional regulator [Rhodococcus fascians]MDQ0283950.1 AcrR family transcriptional regulator [Rhodococcus fascians]